MLQCWNADPESRPSASDVIATLTPWPNSPSTTIHTHLWWYTQASWKSMQWVNTIKSPIEVQHSTNTAMFVCMQLQYICCIIICVFYFPLQNVWQNCNTLLLKFVLYHALLTFFLLALMDACTVCTLHFLIQVLMCCKFELLNCTMLYSNACHVIISYTNVSIHTHIS